MEIPEQITKDFERMMDAVTWHALPLPMLHQRDPYATHYGIVHLPAPFPDLEVVRLNDGRRLILEKSMWALMRVLGVTTHEEEEEA